MANFQHPFVAAMANLGVLPQNPPFTQFQFASPANPIQTPVNRLAAGGFPQTVQGQGTLPMNFQPVFQDPNLIVAALLAQATGALQYPVGQQPIDDKVLVAALHAGQSKGDAILQTLNDLHAANNHTADQWKAYYMANTQRIDQEVLVLKNATQGQALEAAQANPVDSRHDDARVAADEVEEHEDEREQEQEEEEDAGDSSEEEYREANRLPSSRRRRYRNVVPEQHHRTRLTSGRKQRRLPSRYREGVPSSFPSYNSRPTQAMQGSAFTLTLPSTPAHLPSPPTTIIRVGSGPKANIKFSKEDQAFFVKFILWEVHANPLATRKGIVRKVANMAPHHSVESWRTYWRRSGRGQDVFNEALRRHQVASLSPSHTGSSGPSGLASGHDEPDHVQGDSHDTEFPKDDGTMGGAGQAITGGDFHAMARFVASSAWRDASTNTERWAAFTAQYPQRTQSSWMEHFRKHKSRIMELSELYANLKCPLWIRT